MRYFFDTNVLADFGRDANTQRRLDQALRHGVSFAIAPPIFTELVRGLINNAAAQFASNQRVFKWFHRNQFEILALPKPFIALQMKTKLAGPPGVQPKHYAELIEMLATSDDFDHFIRKAEEDGSNWRGIADQPNVHQSQLDKEFAALPEVAATGRDNVARSICSWFGVPGCRPNYLLLSRRFSAALEFLESTFRKVKCGAKPRKNDPGLYIDFQLLLYLGDEGLSFLSNENFGNEIQKSPQRQRIVPLASL
ncbi:MAG TPA: hypothetical protein VKS20_09305 [Candidatus Acidoferrales bacterium]|nr:hypothetical protein [Candidatus Acidoferrales bacterium]